MKTTKKPKPAKKAVKKAPARKPLAKKAPAKRAAKPSAPKKLKPASVPPKPSAATSTDDRKLTFNHAMIYVKDVERGMRFYRECWDSSSSRTFRYEGTAVYARLRAPSGDGTIALHLAGPGVSVASEGVRSTSKCATSTAFAASSSRKASTSPNLPRMMPWGWRHAYLNDPDGHEISSTGQAKTAWRRP